MQKNKNGHDRRWITLWTIINAKVKNVKNTQSYVGHYFIQALLRLAGPPSQHVKVMTAPWLHQTDELIVLWGPGSIAGARGATPELNLANLLSGKSNAVIKTFDLVGWDLNLQSLQNRNSTTCCFFCHMFSIKFSFTGEFNLKNITKIASPAYVTSCNSRITKFSD